MPADASIYGQQQPFRINTPFENLAQVLQVRQQQEAARGLKEQREAIAEQRRALTAKTEQDNATRTAANQALQHGGAVRGDTLKWALANAPDTVAGLTEFFDKADERAENIKKLRRQAQNDEADFLGDVAEGALKHGATPDAVKTALAYAVEHFPDYAEGAQKIAAQLAQAQPDQIRAFLEHVVAQSPSRRGKNAPPQTVSPGQGVLNPSTGKYDVPVPKEDTAGKPASVQEYEYAVKHDGFTGTFKQYQDEDANRKQKAAAERAPYFTYQTTFDPQGRPTGAIRFDARGGPPVRVDVGEVTGGSQLKPPPGTTGQQAVANEVSTAQLDRLKTMFNGGAAAFVGPASGRWENLKQGTPGVGVNKVYADFKAATDAFKNSVIKAITGAQMSEREADRIIGQIPLETDKPQVWLSKAEQTRKNLADLNAVLAKEGTTAPQPPPANETPEARIKRLLGGG